MASTASAAISFSWASVSRRNNSAPSRLPALTPTNSGRSKAQSTRGSVDTCTALPLPIVTSSAGPAMTPKPMPVTACKSEAAKTTPTSSQDTSTSSNTPPNHPGRAPRSRIAPGSCRRRILPDGPFGSSAKK